MIGRDGPDGKSRREQNRLPHRAHLRKLEADGTIVYAGPLRDESDEHSTGAIIVLRAKSLADAKRIVESDPYVSGGVFGFMEVHSFKQAVPKPQ